MAVYVAQSCICCGDEVMWPRLPGRPPKCDGCRYWCPGTRHHAFGKQECRKRGISRATGIKLEVIQSDGKGA